MAHRPWQPCPTHQRSYCTDAECKAAEDHSPLNSTKPHTFAGSQSRFPTPDPIVPKLATTVETQEEFL